MSETVMYNEEVTAETLNNIAIDLGTTTFSYFEDGKSYAVDELNQITSELVGKGILLTENRCNVTYSDGIIYVDTGIIVFENGVKIRITEKKGITAQSGTSFVYALNDTVNNTASIVCSNIAPDDSSDHVKLAEVTDGIVHKYFSVANAKVNLNVANNYQEINDEFTILTTSSDSFILKHSINTEIDTYNFIYCAGWEDSKTHEFALIGKFDEDGECVSNPNYVVECKFKKLPGKIEIYTLFDYSNASPIRICFEKIILA